MSQNAKTPTRIWSFCAVVVTVLSLSPCALVDGEWRVSSPNGLVSVTVFQGRLDSPYKEENNLYYKVMLDGIEVLAFAPLGVMRGPEAGSFITNLAFVNQHVEVINEIYPMISGKKSSHHNHANEKTLTFKNAEGNIMEVIFRAYDDGVAFRYHFPGQGQGSVVREHSGFRLPEGSKGWLVKYVLNYEDYYVRTTAQDERIMEACFPGLFETSTGAWVLLTEAAVYGDYGGSHLVGSLSGSGVFRVKIPGPLSSTLPWSTPWRVAIIGKSLGAIVESVLVDNLNPPSEIEDTSWIKPGISTFPWWSDPNISSNFEKLKLYVDLAADLGWEWIEFMTGLVTDPHPPRYVGTDEWMTVPWVPEFVQYANDKGVNVYGWDHWENLDTPEKRERMFSYFKKIGIKGIKIDFMDSDSQSRFKWRDEAIRDCLKHQLMVSFHGATIPRGQRRRWPHIMTWEAVRGAEFYMSWSKTPPTPEHNCILPFARNAIGPMDYTGVTFSAKGKKTTDAHELALSVIFESGWQNLADAPGPYNASPSRPFLKQVHAAWDDVQFIDGYPAKFVCLARRKGNDWFIACINAANARTVKLPLGFLKKGKYSVKLYCDDEQAGGIAVRDIALDSSKPLVLSIPANGGFSMKVTNSRAK